MRTLQRLLLLLLLATSPAFAENRVISVKFARGAVGATIVEGVARGETATFTLGASAGQKMRVGMSSVEDNAVFLVLGPGGQSLGASVEKNGEQAWYGTLPLSGTYSVVVSTTRGGAEISISFNIR